MDQSKQKRLALAPKEFDLLVWNCPNEVLNGFALPAFAERIGESKESFRQDILRLRLQASTAIVDEAQATLLRNALATTLDQLGPDEFASRTGCDLNQGRMILSRLNLFLGDCQKSSRLSA